MKKKLVLGFSFLWVTSQVRQAFGHFG